MLHDRTTQRIGDTIDGTEAADLLYGTGHDDLIRGFGGDDTIHSSSGSDTVDGGAGDDLIYVDGGEDVLIGGDGVDTLSLERSRRFDITVDLAAGTAVSMSTDSLSGIENVISGGGTDLLIGDAADNLLSGMIGHDTLLGGDGNDTLIGGRDPDLMDGGAGADTFVFVFRKDPFGGRYEDRIEHLTKADFIDLSGMDADRHAPGDQAFHLAEGDTPGRGEVALQWDPDAGVTYLIGQLGIGEVDFTIILEGKHDHFPGLVL